MAPDWTAHGRPIRHGRTHAPEGRTCGLAVGRVKYVSGLPVERELARFLRCGCPAGLCEVLRSSRLQRLLQSRGHRSETPHLHRDHLGRVPDQAVESTAVTQAAVTHVRAGRGNVPPATRSYRKAPAPARAPPRPPLLAGDPETNRTIRLERPFPRRTSLRSRLHVHEHHLDSVPGPRSRRGQCYSLTAILLVCVCAVVSAARSTDELAEWGARALNTLLATIGISSAGRHTMSPTAIGRVLGAVDGNALHSVKANIS